MAVDMSGAIEWWDEWQLRILVLGSLAVQWFLLLTAPMRKYSIPGWLRKLIWLAFISSDALAIYALATLFNWHGKASSYCTYQGRASSLEVLWAPILLVHLGGRDEITAFNIEDNELWSRHTVTLVSQVTVALYAFCKSWPEGNDRRLLVSAVLLFVCGIINFCEKPWALRNAAMNRLVAMSSTVEGEIRTSTFWDYECFSSICPQMILTKTKAVLTEMDQVQMILADMSVLAAVKGGAKQRKLRPGVDITSWLQHAFELIYTRANVLYSPWSIASNFMLVPALHLAAIILFAQSRKQGYSHTDVKMTYIFICSTAVLDVLGMPIGCMVHYLMSKCLSVTALCKTLLGCNIWQSVQRRMGPWYRRCCLLDLWNNCCWVDSFKSEHSGRVADFLVYKLLKPGKVEKLDLASYRSLDENKHNWALGEDELRSVRSKTTVKEVLCDLPFDESVLLWHIATDLCSRDKERPVVGTSENKKPDRELCTDAISNYMAYLLYFHPDMLMTGSRKHLFTQTMEDLKELLEKATARHIVDANDKDLADLIVSEEQGGTNESNKKSYSLISKACKLAGELKDMELERQQRLLYCVWIGMLCYSASMCRGYLHAKALAEGGEFLTFVWLVISLKGARTLADKLQMPQLPEGQGAQEDQDASDEDDISQF